jgi:hypothetical protein
MAINIFFTFDDVDHAGLYTAALQVPLECKVVPRAGRVGPVLDPDTLLGFRQWKYASCWQTTALVLIHDISNRLPGSHSGSGGTLKDMTIRGRCPRQQAHVTAKQRHCASMM